MILPWVHFKDMMHELQCASGLGKLVASSLGIVCGIWERLKSGQVQKLMAISSSLVFKKILQFFPQVEWIVYWPYTYRGIV